MSDLKTISKDICNNKNLDRNISLYISNMMSLYSRFSYIKLSMNYYTFVDAMADRSDDNSREVLTVLSKLNGIMNDTILNNADNSEVASALTQIEAIRNSVIDTMEALTAYIDRFSLYEHIFNRIEFRFNDEKFDNNYYENYLSNDIMNYILSDKDAVVMNSRINEMVGQLPMRLTRKKFFELVKDALNLYKNQEKSSLDDFMYVLNTVSGIYEPAGFRERFPLFEEILNKLADADFKEITKEIFEEKTKLLSFAVSEVTAISDTYVMLMELINDIYVILLASDVAFCDSDERMNAVSIIKSVMEHDDINDVAEEVTDNFIAFEGCQEKIYSQISSNDYVIDEALKSFEKELSDMQLNDKFDVLVKVSKLSSGSQFVDLNKVNDKTLADEAYVDGVFDAFYQELSKVFGLGKREYNRAVMSVVLSSLPVFFNNVNEIQDYVNVSLSQCTDEAEKKACASLIKMIIEEV